MSWKYLLFLAVYSSSLIASPPSEIPNDLYDEYTMGGKIKVTNWYFDDTNTSGQPTIFKIEQINGYIEDAKKQSDKYYGATDKYLYEILNKYITCIQGKSVAIIGTVLPWYESIILSYGGYPTTIEYNEIISEDPRITVMTVEEYNKHPIKFDAILSISSIEHDGLGRYGDPINPRGDIEAMQKMKSMIDDNGILILAVPIGKDHLFWNAHRIYGSRRLPLLLAGWELIDSAGFSWKDIRVFNRGHHQPILVLRPAK